MSLDSSLKAGELLKELVILKKVEYNLKLLLIHNTHLRANLEIVTSDLKRVQEKLLSKNKKLQLDKHDLNALVDHAELQRRMIHYLKVT